MIACIPDHLKEKDKANRQALMKRFPSYAGRMSFVVERCPVYNRASGHIEIRWQTTMIISFAEERAKDARIDHNRQLSIWGIVPEQEVSL